MYQDLSLTTVPKPLSAGLIIMSCRFLRLRSACRSSFVKLSVMWLRLTVRMSCLMASTYVLSAGSRSVGGVHELLLWNGLCSLGWVLLLWSWKYSFKRIRRVKSLISADTSAKLIRLGVGQKVKPQARTNNSSLESGVWDKLITEVVLRLVFFISNLMKSSVVCAAI